MSNAATAIALVQNAMLHAGQAPLESWTEDSDAGDTVRRLYPTQKAFLLGCHPWKFADGRSQMSRKSAAPNSEWPYQFVMPRDRVANPRCYFNDPDPGMPPYQRFELGAGVVFSDAEALWCAYTRDIAEGHWSPTFTAFAEHALAAVFGVAFQVNDSIIEREDRIAWGLPSEGRRGGLFSVARSADGRFAPTRSLIVGGGALLQARQTRA